MAFKPAGRNIPPGSIYTMALKPAGRKMDTPLQFDKKTFSALLLHARLLGHLPPFAGGDCRCHADGIVHRPPPAGGAGCRGAKWCGVTGLVGRGALVYSSTFPLVFSLSQPLGGDTAEIIFHNVATVGFNLFTCNRWHYEPANKKCIPPPFRVFYCPRG